MNLTWLDGKVGDVGCAVLCPKHCESMDLRGLKPFGIANGILISYDCELCKCDIVREQGHLAALIKDR
jgi:hypothetical protein